MKLTKASFNQTLVGVLVYIFEWLINVSMSSEGNHAFDTFFVNLVDVSIQRSCDLKQCNANKSKLHLDL